MFTGAAGIVEFGVGAGPKRIAVWPGPGENRAPQFAERHMATKPTGLNDAQFLELLQKVLPKATKDTRLAHTIYEQVAHAVRCLFVSSSHLGM